MLTLKQTWGLIAEAFETKPEDRTAKQEELTWSGICCALLLLRDESEITQDRYRLMDNTVKDCLPVADSGVYLYEAYLCAVGDPEGDAIRANFCREQAAKL